MLLLLQCQISRKWSSVKFGLCADPVVLVEPENAFSKLMNRQRTLVYPEIKVEKDGKDFLQNSIVELLKSEGAGFFSDEKGDMNGFVKTMVSVLWMLDG